MDNISPDEIAVNVLQMQLEQCQRDLKKCRSDYAELAHIFEQVTNIIIVLDVDGLIIEANPSACVALGFSRTELLAMKPWFFVMHVFCDEIIALIHAIAPNISATRQCVMRKADGTELAMEVHLNRSVHMDRELIVFSGRDISEHKKLEAQLRRSEKILARGQALTKTGTWVLKFNSGETEFSDEACRIFGFQAPSSPSHYLSFRAGVRLEDQECLDATLRETFELGQSRLLEYVYLHPNGTRKKIETISTPLLDENGSTYQLLNSVMDVTERNRTQDELRRSEAYLAEAQKLSGVGSMNINLTNGELWCSEETMRIAAFEPGSKPTVDDAMLRVHPEDRERIQVILGQASIDRLPLKYEHRLSMPDGSIKYVHVVAHTVENELNELEFFGAVMDITEQKKTEEAMRASELLARGQLDALTQTLGALAKESDSETLLQYVLEIIARQFGAVGVGVWEMEESLGQVQLRYNYDCDSLSFVLEHGGRSPPDYFTLVQYHPIWTEFFKTGTRYVICDVREDAVSFRFSDALNGPWFDWSPYVGINAMAKSRSNKLYESGIVWTLAVPMVIAGKVIGLISIRFKVKRAFSLAELELASALTHQAVLAIQLRRLSVENRQVAVVAERNRLARDIHDTLAHGLTGVIVQLEAAKDALSRGLEEDLDMHLERAGNLAREGLNEARRSVYALRPLGLGKKNLLKTLERLIQDLTAGTTMTATFGFEGGSRTLPVEWEDNLVRIAQEALTNALRHGRATEFRSKLIFGSEEIRFEIHDNGSGFDSTINSDGFGLLGMRERIASMNGELFVESVVGTGTSVIAVLRYPYYSPE